MNKQKHNNGDRFDCQEFEILISAAIDGELEPSEFQHLESHVDQCEHCRRQYQQLDLVTDWLIAHDRSEINLVSGLATPPVAPVSSAINPGSKNLVETSAHQSHVSALHGDINGPANKQAGFANDESETTTYVKRSNVTNPDDSQSFRGRNFLAGGMLAATAAGLAALLSSSPVEPPSVPTVQLSDVSQPAERATILNGRSLVLQASQAQAMQRELQVLRLMADNCDASPEEVAVIQTTIASLTERIRRLNEHTSLQP